MTVLDRLGLEYLFYPNSLILTTYTIYMYIIHVCLFAVFFFYFKLKLQIFYSMVSAPLKCSCNIPLLNTQVPNAVHPALISFPQFGCWQGQTFGRFLDLLLIQYLLPGISWEKRCCAITAVTLALSPPFLFTLYMAFWWYSMSVN